MIFLILEALFTLVCREQGECRRHDLLQCCSGVSCHVLWVLLSPSVYEAFPWPRRTWDGLTRGWTLPPATITATRSTGGYTMIILTLAYLRHTWQSEWEAFSASDSLSVRYLTTSDHYSTLPSVLIDYFQQPYCVIPNYSSLPKLLQFFSLFFLFFFLFF